MADETLGQSVSPILIKLSETLYFFGSQPQIALVESSGHSGAYNMRDMVQTLPVQCSHDDIRRLVVDWWELLAIGNYREAFEMFLHDDWEIPWSPEHLETAIATYGCFEPYPGDPKWEAGSIFAQPNPQEIIAAIEVDRENPSGRDPPEYNGMVHFNDVPLKQRVSTMTARFHIKRVSDDQLTLEFLDVHVM